MAYSKKISGTHQPKIEKDFWYLIRDKNLDKWQVESDCVGVEGIFEGTPLKENPPKWYKERMAKEK